MRQPRHAQETRPNPGWERPSFDDTSWPRVTSGYGPKFWKLGPLPEDVDATALDAQLAEIEHVDPSVPVEHDGRTYAWQPYAFSWRWGIEGDPGHQGYHGLKAQVSDDFIALGKLTYLVERPDRPELREGAGRVAVLPVDHRDVGALPVGTAADGREPPRRGVAQSCAGERRRARRH